MSTATGWCYDRAFRYLTRCRQRLLHHLAYSYPVNAAPHSWHDSDTLTLARWALRPICDRFLLLSFFMTHMVAHHAGVSMLACRSKPHYDGLNPRLAPLWRGFFWERRG